MKTLSPMKGMLAVSAILICTVVSGQIHHLEPPFWWSGMKNPKLQLMVHGADISETRPVIEYEGVRIQSVQLVENSNYLFINLDIDPDVSPGTFDIRFYRKDKVVESCNYELKERERGSTSRTGVNSSDAICLIMPDRFANGEPSNDQFEDMPDKLNREDDYGRHGGDIQGILDHLDYLADMGFTAIWLNPVLENNMKSGAYHGYATTDFYKVDRRLGSNELYRHLSDLAAERGIKLIMDMIFNHCGLDHWWMEDLPSMDWINGIPDPKITTHTRTVNQDPYVSEHDKREMLDGWFVPSMPDLNQRNPFMAEYLIQNSIWWIEYAKLAGIRQDTYPYPEKDLMAEWNRRVLEEYPDFHIVGEEWTPNQAIVSYWQKGKINADGYQGFMPGVLDFPLQFALHSALTEEEGFEKGLFKLYECLANDFQYPDPYKLIIFSDNHDMSRFFMQVGQDVDLYKLGISFLLTTRGIPQIFYGSEILMTHNDAGHGAIRKDFPGGWEGDDINGFTGHGLSEQELEMQQFFRTLLNWRKDKAVIHQGKLMHFVPEDGVYVFFRYNDNDRVMVILNKNREEKKLELERFSEIIGDSRSAKDILSGKQFELGGAITLPATAPLVLELE